MSKMACSETSFDSYTFKYQWKVNDLEARIQNPTELISPAFNSPPGAQPATRWKLSIPLPPDPILVTDRSGPRSSSETTSERYLSVDLTRLPANCNTAPSTISQPIASFGGLTGPLTRSGVTTTSISTMNAVPSASTRSPDPNVPRLTIGGGHSIGHPPLPTFNLGCGHGLLGQKQFEKDVWGEAHLKAPKIVKKTSTSHNITSLGPKRLSVDGYGSGLFPTRKAVNDQNTISFKQFLPLSAIRHSQCVIFECEIKVWSLDKPIHVEPRSLQPISSEAVFNLSKIMEEARRKNLFTDVTLVVADRKEFKAHKVVLASQSQFFKTRFESHWTGQRIGHHLVDRVEMTDVPASVMEVILSYVYTGKVANIDKIAIHILPSAEEYGLEGLKLMCEEALAKTVTSNNAIDILIHADTNNALNLKKVCMDYISTNTASVQESGGWCKLKETQIHHGLWVELLEKVIAAQLNQSK